MEVGDLVYITFIDDKGTLKEETKITNFRR